MASMDVLELQSSFRNAARLFDILREVLLIDQQQLEPLELVRFLGTPCSNGG